MEKLCIVKRRQQYWQVNNKYAMQNSLSSTLKSNDVIANIGPEDSTSCLRKKRAEDFSCFPSHAISIAMNQEQTNMLQTSEYIKRLLDGIIPNTAFDIKRNADGLILLNLRFNESPLMRMLRINQLCEILQISRSFLTRIIRDEKIKSYKVGRLRRFLWADVLEYLQSNEQLAQLNNMKQKF
jgi:excisionase family DNA binding protein